MPVVKFIRRGYQILDSKLLLLISDRPGNRPVRSLPTSGWLTSVVQYPHIVHQ